MNEKIDLPPLVISPTNTITQKHKIRHLVMTSIAVFARFRTSNVRFFFYFDFYGEQSVNICYGRIDRKAIRGM